MPNCKKCLNKSATATDPETALPLCQGCYTVVTSMRSADPVKLYAYLGGSTAKAPAGPLGLVEAAALLGCSVSGLRKMCHRRAIRYRQAKPHAPIYFERSWIEEYIERKSIKPPARAVRNVRQPIPDSSDDRFRVYFP